MPISISAVIGVHRNGRPAGNSKLGLKILDIAINCTLKVINYIITILLPNLIIYSCYYREILSPCAN